MNENFLTVLILGVCLIGCTERKRSTIPSSSDSIAESLDVPDTLVNKEMLIYNPKKSLWTLNNQLFSGYAVSFYEDGTLEEKFGILNGRKENEAIQWHVDGHYKRTANYHLGKLNGDKKYWSPDSSHTLLSHLKYVSGKPHGEQKKWYPTGELFKILNLNMGKEEGMQKAFRKNGALFANYEAREGRIFGLKKAALCYGLEDEKIRTKKE